MKLKRMKRVLKLAIDGLIVWARSLRPYRRTDFASCGTGVYVSPGVKFFNPERISIGNDVYFGPGCTVFGYGGVTIENDVVVGDRVTILSANHDFDGPNVESIPFGSGYVSRPVSVSRGAWLGSQVIVRPGASIGRFSVVGAGAVVGGKVQDFGIYGGNPAVLISLRKNQGISNLTSKWVSSKSHSIRILD